MNAGPYPFNEPTQSAFGLGTRDPLSEEPATPDWGPQVSLNDLGPATVFPEEDETLEPGAAGAEPTPVERAIARALSAGEESEVE